MCLLSFVFHPLLQYELLPTVETAKEQPKFTSLPALVDHCACATVVEGKGGYALSSDN
jgi:hypothetical protein